MNRANQQNKESNKRGWLIVAGSIFLLIIILLVAISLFAEPMIRDRLENEANTTLGPEMELLIGDLNIGYFPLSVSLHNIELFINTGASPQWPESAVEQIQVSGISLWDLLFQQDFNARKVEITNAVLHLAPELLDTIETENDTEDEDFEIKIGRIHLNGSEVNIYRLNEESPHTVISGIELLLYDLDFSSDKEQLIDMISDLDMRMGSASHVTDDGHYELRSSQLHFALSSGDFSLKQFELIPLLTVHELPEKLGHQVDHFDISSQQIHIRGIDTELWFNSRVIRASAIEVNDLILEISRDKNFSEKPREEEPLLNEQFAHLEIETSIDSLHFKGGSITYRELKEEQEQFGEILFDSIDIEFLGIQNRDPEETIKATVFTNFMGLSELNVDFEFHLGENATQKISGKLGSMDLEEMNEVVKHLAFVRIDDGQLKSLSFDFTANNQIAQGVLTIIYDNLSITILDEKSLEETLGRNIASFFTNLVVLRSSNDEDDPRVGEIEFEREKERSMFNYWWKIIRDGLMSSVARM